ncbi:hypothetical protein T492DRAFT_215417 [Pavlovales sp. CCMP2436]|nr:hypothetical protein T492DRAFT_215417 [Pavlovales sp. CCMP2436]
MAVEDRVLHQPTVSKKITRTVTDITAHPKRTLVSKQTDTETEKATSPIQKRRAWGGRPPPRRSLQNLRQRRGSAVTPKLTVISMAEGWGRMEGRMALHPPTVSAKVTETLTWPSGILQPGHSLLRQCDHHGPLPRCGIRQFASRRNCEIPGGLPACGGG